MIVNISFKRYCFSFRVNEGETTILQLKKDFRQSINDLVSRSKLKGGSKNYSQDQSMMKYKLINYGDLESIIMMNSVLKFYDEYDKEKLKELKDSDILKAKSSSFPQIYNLGLAVILEVPVLANPSILEMPIENLISYCTNSNEILEESIDENTSYDKPPEEVNVIGLLSSLMNINNPIERENIIRLIHPLMDNPRSNIIMNDRRQDDVTIMNISRNSIVSRSSTNEDLVSNLISLGFSDSEARWALSQSGNNLEQAANLIINQLN